MPLITGGGAQNIGSSAITDGAITNIDINNAAAIAWSKISKVGATVDDLAEGYGLKVKTVSLSSANILGMFGTPVEVIAAPGVGKVLVPVAMLFYFIPGGTPYTGGGAISLRFAGDIDSILETTVSANIVTEAGSPGVFSCERVKSALTAAQGMAANTAIQITNATAAFAGGNGTAKLFIVYRVFTL